MRSRPPSKVVLVRIDTPDDYRAHFGTDPQTLEAARP